LLTETVGEGHLDRRDGAAGGARAPPALPLQLSRASIVSEILRHFGTEAQTDSLFDLAVE
jgi:hypothetical protein